MLGDNRVFQTFFERLIGKRVDRYKEEINIRNYSSFRGLAIVGALISIIVLCFGMLLSEVVTFNVEFFLIFCYFIGMFLISYYLKRHMRYITMAFYLALVPLMLIGILMGTFLDPTEPSITIMVFLCVLPLFLLDKPWRILSFITLTAIIYCICCYIAKDQTMFIADLIDLVAFYFLAVGVNYFILNERVDNVDNFIKYREKSEKDLLTGIYNRGGGVEKIQHLLEQKIYGAFIIIDADNFKIINDTYGHIIGDVCLIEISKRLQEYFHEDIVLRLGGDEFAIYSSRLINRDLCEVCFRQFYNSLKTIKVIQDSKFVLSVSSGCVIGDEDLNFEQIYRSCDEYLYEAKKSGKGRYQIKATNS